MMSGHSLVEMIEHDYKNSSEEFDPFLDDAELVELGKSKELISEELYMPIHISRDWVRCYVTTTQPENFRMYLEGKSSKRFLLSAKQFGDSFLISTYEDFPAAVNDVKPRRGYVAKVQQNSDLSYLVTLNHCHLCDDHLGYFKCGREHDEREVVAKVVHSVKKYHVINTDFKCLSVTIPSISENGRRKIWCPRSFRKVEPSLPNSADVNDGLFYCPSMGTKYVNKLPDWNPKLESLVLKFQGNRILTASSKNFLLYDEKFSKFDFAEAKVRQTATRAEARETLRTQALSNASATAAAATSTSSTSNGVSSSSTSQKDNTSSHANNETTAAATSGSPTNKTSTKPNIPRLPILQSLFGGLTNNTEVDDDEEDRASARRARNARQPQRPRTASGDASLSPMSTFRSSDATSPPNTNRSVESVVTPRTTGQGIPPRRSKKSTSSRPRDAADVAIMQFGKSTSTRFVLDFRYPLSPIQAFGIALSSFGSERTRSGSSKKK